METWILVVLIYAGAFARGDSVALQTIRGFDTKARCESAGKELEPLVKASAKEVRYVCLRAAKQEVKP